MKMKKQEPDTTAPQGRTKVHNVRFYNLAPRSIERMAHNKATNKLALSRNDGSIELWDMQHAPCLEKTIPQSPGNSVEGIVWAGERLFSVGLSGELVEWDLQTLQPRRTQHVTGNAIWCVAVNAACSELAIGTEEGYINIFDISDDQLMYKRLFDKQEGRVLCCKFDAQGEHLVTGSMDALRIWDVRSGHAVQKMSIARAERNKEVTVWALQLLSDFTIVAGDSRGQVTVWDGRTAALLESHQVLQADVLTVVVNEEENLLMCSGIEPIIRIYAKTQIRREEMVFNRWVKFLQRSVHDHDVKALVCAGDAILSGGVDGYLGVSSMSKAKPSIAKYGPFLQNPCVTVSPAHKLLLLRYTNYLEVWQLGSSSGKPSLDAVDEPETGGGPVQKKQPQRKFLALDVPPEKLLELKSKYEEPVVCAAISPDGQWLCYSTPSKARLFRFVLPVPGKSKTRLQRVVGLPEQFRAASHMQFSSDSKRLFFVHPLSREIQIFAVVANGLIDLDYAESIETRKHIKDTISHFCVSACGNYVVAAATDHTIAVWSVFKGKHFKHHLNLPRYSAATTAVAIHTAEAPRLVANFSDSKMFEYDLEEMCFTCSERDYFVPSSETHCVTNITLDQRNPAVFIMQNDANFFVLQKSTPRDEQELEEAVAGKKSLKKAKRLVCDEKVARLRLKSQRSFKHLIHLCWLSADELVAVGVNPIALVEQLPDAFKQKKFGVS